MLYGSLVKRLRRRPLTAKTAVRFRYELRVWSPEMLMNKAFRGLLFAVADGLVRFRSTFLAAYLIEFL